MTDAKGRYIGNPTHEVFYVPATPELVARTRDRITRAVEKVSSRQNGYAVKVTVHWAETAPAGYGQSRSGSYDDLERPPG